MKPDLLLGVATAMASALVLNWAYVQEHDAASAMPSLSIRRPLHAARLLLSNRAWVVGALGEASGFGLYVIALALAPLSIVQTVSAGGIAVLSWLSNRRAGRRPARREHVAVLVALLGLAGLGVSLADPPVDVPVAAIDTVFAWLLVSTLLAALAPALGRLSLGPGVSWAVTAGVLIGSADVAMKTALEGGGRVWFLIYCAAGYAIGTLALQIAYQHAGAITAAGITTLLTAALPIVAATTILHEGLPPGALGVLRVVAFVTVIGGAVALARPEGGDAEPVQQRREQTQLT